MKHNGRLNSFMILVVVCAMTAGLVICITSFNVLLETANISFFGISKGGKKKRQLSIRHDQRRMGLMGTGSLNVNLSVAVFGTSNAYGNHLDNRYDAFPYLLSPMVDNYAHSEVQNLNYYACCTETAVGDEAFYDVIIIDFWLRFADGLEHLVRRLRRRFPSAAIILMKTWSPSQFRRKASKHSKASASFAQWKRSENLLKDARLSQVIEALRNDNGYWFFPARANADKVIDTLGRNYGTLTFQMPVSLSDRDSKESLISYLGFFDDTQHSRLSMLGHEEMASGLQSLIETYYSPSQLLRDRRVGHWSFGDSCHNLWYSTGHFETSHNVVLRYDQEHLQFVQLSGYFENENNNNGNNENDNEAPQQRLPGQRRRYALQLVQSNGGGNNAAAAAAAAVPAAAVVPPASTNPVLNAMEGMESNGTTMTTTTTTNSTIGITPTIPTHIVNPMQQQQQQPSSSDASSSPTSAWISVENPFGDKRTLYLTFLISQQEGYYPSVLASWDLSQSIQTPARTTASATSGDDGVASSDEARPQTTPSDYRYIVNAQRTAFKVRLDPFNLETRDHDTKTVGIGQFPRGIHNITLTVETTTNQQQEGEDEQPFSLVGVFWTDELARPSDYDFGPRYESEPFLQDVELEYQ